ATSCRSCHRRRSTALKTASPISLRGGMLRATTVTSGPKCCQPTPSPASRRKASSTPTPARPSATISWPGAAAANPWSCSSPSAGANLRWMRCCATAACVENKQHEQPIGTGKTLHRRGGLPRLQPDGYHPHVPGRRGSPPGMRRLRLRRYPGCARQFRAQRIAYPGDHPALEQTGAHLPCGAALSQSEAEEKGQLSKGGGDSPGKTQPRTPRAMASPPVRPATGKQKVGRRSQDQGLLRQVNPSPSSSAMLGQRRHMSWRRSSSIPAL